MGGERRIAARYYKGKLLRKLKTILQDSIGHMPVIAIVLRIAIVTDVLVLAMMH